MPETTTQAEESKATPNGSEVNGQQPDAEPKPPAALSKPPQLTATPKKRPAARVVALLVVAALVAGAGYTFRSRLRALVSNDTGQATQTAERKVLYWVDPMHPAYKSNKPGTAPDCGMDLVPVYEEGAEAKTNAPAGAIQISAEKQQLIGVQYGEAVYKPVSRTLRAVGRLAYDETKITRIHPKIEGWVEQVFVDFTGKEVRRGEPLLSLYSPDLLQTQQEFLLARRGRNELAESPFREAVAGSESLYQAARRRLELWDVTEGQIREIERTGRPQRALTIHAPSGGFVLARNAYARQRVTPDTELYQIADLSTVWVLADIYEYEAPEVKLGQAATVTLSYLPGRAYRGKVTYIYPQLDSTTRTLKARIEVPNPGFALKPDMYANVELKIDYGRRVVVPEEAVMDAGAEQTVFVAREGGYFEPRRVTLGAKVDREYIVLGGLKAGERVVTSANFLIDSESKLKSAAGGMGMPGMSHGEGTSNQSPSAPKDHSEHRATPTPDHSQHQPPRQQQQQQPQPQPKAEDHSGHQSAAESDARPHGPAEDHSAHTKAAAEHDHAKETGQVLYYYCPMHEDQRSNQPGKCPKCKMSLIPKHAGRK
jgi:membrane fusion protein, copper/silver efflux system